MDAVAGAGAGAPSDGVAFFVFFLALPCAAAVDWFVPPFCGGDAGCFLPTTPMLSGQCRGALARFLSPFDAYARARRTHSCRFGQARRKERCDSAASALCCASWGAFAHTAFHLLDERARAGPKSFGYVSTTCTTQGGSFNKSAKLPTRTRASAVAHTPATSPPPPSEDGRREKAFL